MQEIKISEDLINSDLSDLEFYIYVLTKCLRTENYYIIVSVDSLSKHCGYISNIVPSIQKRHIRNAISRLVNLNMIIYQPRIYEIQEIDPNQKFEILINSYNDYEVNCSNYISINKLILIRIFSIKKLSKLKLLRNYYKQKLAQDKMDGNYGNQ